MPPNEFSSNDEPETEPGDFVGSERREDLPRPHSSARFVWIGTVACIVAGAVLLFEPFQDPLPQRPNGALEGPDLELEDALITQFRDSGRLKYRLRSPRIQHFEPQALTELVQPDLELHSQPDPPWRMTARSGTINNAAIDGEREEIVYLDQDVQMEQHHDDGRQLSLRTPAITVYPDREYAETSQDVIITSHAGRTTAVGLKGNLDRGLLHLFSDAEQRVHTILLPDQFK